MNTSGESVLLLREIGVDPPLPVRDLFRAVLAMGSHGDRVEGICFVLNLDRFRIHRMLTGAGLPPASLIRSWGIVLRCLLIYRAGDATLEDAGRQGAGISHSQLSDMTHRVSGLRPMVWRDTGASLLLLRRRMVTRWKGGEVVA